MKSFLVRQSIMLAGALVVGFAFHRALYYILVAIWLFFGSGEGAHSQVPDSTRWACLLHNIVAVMHQFLGPGTTLFERMAAIVIPTVLLWIEVPLRQGLAHGSTYIAGAACLAVIAALAWRSPC